jgi:hypothetical protein
VEAAMTVADSHSLVFRQVCDRCDAAVKAKLTYVILTDAEIKALQKESEVYLETAGRS